MNRVRTLYRSTLIAAALATASLNAATIAEAHEQGWRGHGERAWQPAPPPRWYRAGYRYAQGSGYGGWRYGPGVRDCEVPFVGPAYSPAPRPYLPRVVLELPATW